MALIKSISGIRGTIGGAPGENLTPIDIIKFATAYGEIILESAKKPTIVIGRDGRISGKMVRDFVANTLSALGINVIDLGVTTTPTVEIAVKMENANGGIVITASHNPMEWNALKLLNNEGEFVSAETGAKVLEIANREQFSYKKVNQLGKIKHDESYLQKHISAILQYPLVNKEAIAASGFKVVVDGINSSGSLYVPELLKALGVENIIVLNEKIDGKFAHNPEPLPEHLSGLSDEVVKQKAHLGISVDPDVDRLCFVCDDGSMFGEEYTLVAIADYFLSHQKGNTVSNLSSTKALKEITLKHGGEYFASAVGEVNVVKMMKETDAVIGGEGNGGIIIPDFHYGRDALIGIALFLSHLAQHKKGIKSLRNLYPSYFISKNKLELASSLDIKPIFENIKAKYAKNNLITIDGLKIEFESDWVHLRSSNTEPIVRIYAESNNETTANNIAMQIMRDIKEFSN